MPEKPLFTKLKNRGLLKISGADRKSFLQGLISNDINLLDTQPILYACLLTPQGKFLYDFFISEVNDTLFLDCEGGQRLLDLTKLLGIYKLRSNVILTPEPEIDVYAIFSHDNHIPDDPRHRLLGKRSFTAPENAAEQPFEYWDKLRIGLSVPDGSRDMISGQSTLLECGIDTLNGISFNKGCYMGQELTARTHYRGLIKKHLYVVSGENLPEPGTAIIANAQTIGEMRSRCENYGLALIKDEALDWLKGSGIEVLSTC